MNTWINNSYNCAISYLLMGLMFSRWWITVWHFIPPGENQIKDLKHSMNQLFDLWHQSDWTASNRIKAKGTVNVPSLLDCPITSVINQCSPASRLLQIQFHLHPIAISLGQKRKKTMKTVKNTLKHFSCTIFDYFMLDIFTRINEEKRKHFQN